MKSEPPFVGPTLGVHFICELLFFFHILFDLGHEFLHVLHIDRIVDVAVFL